MKKLAPRVSDQRPKPLTRDEWDDLRTRVFERDLVQAWRRRPRSEKDQNIFGWRRGRQHRACVPAFLDPELSGTCSGRLTFDHVPCRTTMRKKAPDDERHLQTVCEWHHGTNRVGGGVATSRRAREVSRSYLADLYPGPHDCLGKTR